LKKSNTSTDVYAHAVKGTCSHAIPKTITPTKILKPIPLKKAYELGRSFQLSCTGQSDPILGGATDEHDTMPMGTQDLEAAVAAAAAPPVSPPSAKGATWDDAALQSDSPGTKRAKYQQRVEIDAQSEVPQEDSTSHVPSDTKGDEAEVPDHTFSDAEPEVAGPPEVLQTCFRNLAFYLYSWVMTPMGTISSELVIFGS
jgi:hypothetical protein